METGDSKNWDEERLARSELETQPDLESTDDDFGQRETIIDFEGGAASFRARMETLTVLPNEDEVFTRITEAGRVPRNTLQIVRQSSCEGRLNFMEVLREGADITYIYLLKGAHVPQETLGKRKITLPTDATVLIQVTSDGKATELYRWED